MRKKSTRDKILDYIISYQDKNGWAPTRQEITDKFGWASKRAASYHLEVLSKEKKLTLGKGSRAISVN